MKKIAAYSAIALLGMAGQAAHAHTTVRVAGMEGVAGYNDFVTPHGCVDNTNPTAPDQDVIALSALFPNSPDPAMAKVYRLNAQGIQVEELPDLSADIQGVNPGVGFTALGARLVAGHNTMFGGNFLPILDADRRVRGYHTWAGPAPYDYAPLAQTPARTTGLSPWRHGAVRFRPESCARSLRVRIAVVNWCKRGVRTANDGDRLDVWIGHTTGVFNDQRTMPRATPYNPATEVPFWPTFTINRDLVNNPLPSACGEGFALAVQPADADIDAWLAPQVGPFRAGRVPGARFFPSAPSR